MFWEVKIPLKKGGFEAPKIVGEVQRHTTTGYLITRHLLSCKINGENVEYLQAYLEITGAWMIHLRKD